ncbi:DNA-O6-methylguanine--protein-cysteine S-methyltransferase [Burkholderia sp. WP9]|uniref:methylated-DNA--[protein]-cysteine S-methyltransferase n=1 Tax=Burkholderia sp. WP9 TaxID=1500263 RepID=UPI00089A1C64|nr:methylated-DNA--[protein]-cysteine S-methyltransferase [Burkholderia sp. WP9]SED36651.1 DNA-O6-methylguanine--protein-cysteine S-methyltransferase [Burkholderia sp. WP9]
MKAGPVAPFKYNFRAPGCQVEGPIRYAIGQAVCGSVLIGRSRQGICAIFLGENAQELYDELAVAFPDVELIADRQSLLGELGQVVAFIDKGIAERVINLDIGGIPFQQEVWQALCGIPAGQTRSYSEIAQHLGVPEAVRAVAGACAANVLAIAIPCHRVVRSDGTISGYRWGVDRKRALLVEERGQ